MTVEELIKVIVAKGDMLIIFVLRMLSLVIPIIVIAVALMMGGDDHVL